MLLAVQIVFILIAINAFGADATKCAPLSRFRIDCNTCYCSVDGRTYTCTKRFCTSDVSVITSTDEPVAIDMMLRGKADIDNIDKVCEPLSRFMVNCNTCYCNLDGSKYTCTTRQCSDVEFDANELMEDPLQNVQEGNDGKEEWGEYLNDLVVNSEEIKPPEGDDENHIDYGDYLKDDTEYIGSLKRGWRF